MLLFCITLIFLSSIPSLILCRKKCFSFQVQHFYLCQSFPPRPSFNNPSLFSSPSSVFLSISFFPSAHKYTQIPFSQKINFASILPSVQLLSSVPASFHSQASTCFHTALFQHQFHCTVTFYFLVFLLLQTIKLVDMCVDHH